MRSGNTQSFLPPMGDVNSCKVGVEPWKDVDLPLPDPLESAQLPLPSPVQIRGCSVWEGSYYWVVFCKNHRFHMRQNFRHRITLAETDAVAPLRSLGKLFTVRCDECGKTYTYRRKDVLRVEQAPPEAFKPHPLFQEEPSKDEALNDSSRNAKHSTRTRPRRRDTARSDSKGRARQKEPPKRNHPKRGAPLCIAIA